MEKIIFKCLRCGHCCRNLLKDIDGELKGLNLTLEETTLFPKEFVAPSFGLGYGGKDRPKYIILYQLDANECPHLSSDNSCKIHENRPLACRTFPLISIGPLGTAVANATDCHFVRESESKYGSLYDTFLTPEEFIAPEEWSALTKHNDLTRREMIKHITDAALLWSFNLKTKKWEVVAGTKR